MIKKLTFSAFFFLALVANAQNTISGTVYDDKNNVIEASEIKLVQNKKSKLTRSGKDGKYKFSDVENGEYVLVIKVGKKEELISIVVKDQDLLQDVEFSTLDHIDLAIVDIKKIKSVKNELEKQGFAMNVIETAEAATRNIQTNELLDRTVGVRIRQNGGLGSRVDYNLNGMSGNSVRVFIDGLPLSTYGSSFNLNSIPPALIERIEVYKGVIPGYLSDDAMGGAINVILKKGARNTLNASVSYGSFNTTQTNLFGFYRAKSGFTTKVSGFYNYSDNDYKVWGEHVYNILPNGRYEHIKAKRFNDAYESFGGRVEVGFSDVKWADNFMISYNGSDDYKEIQHGQFMTKPYKGRFTESNANVLGVTYDKKDIFTEGLDVNLNVSYSKNKETINDTVKYNYNWDGTIALDLDGNPILSPNGAQQGAPTINHINREIITGRSAISYRINPNHRIFLNNYYYQIDRTDNDEMKSVLEKSFLGTRDLTKTISSISYDFRAFDEKLKINAFWKHYNQKIEKMDPVLKQDANGNPYRFEEVTKSNFNTEGYGIAASYLIKDGITFLVSAEKAVRMPNDNELFGNPGDNLDGAINLRPEISNNANVGFKLGPYKLQSHTLSFSTAGFIRDTKDKIVRKINDRNNDAVQTIPMENLGKTQSIGYEFEVGYKYGRNFNALVSLSQFNTLYKIQYDSNGNQLEYYNEQIPNEPYFNGNASMQYVFRNVIKQGGHLSLNYNLGYVHAFKTNWQKNAFETPDQFVHDAGFSYAFPNKNFIVSFDARNIFNEQAFDNYAVQKPGRAFYLKLNYTINKF